MGSAITKVIWGLVERLVRDKKEEIFTGIGSFDAII